MTTYGRRSGYSDLRVPPQKLRYSIETLKRSTQNSFSACRSASACEKATTAEWTCPAHAKLAAGCTTYAPAMLAIRWDTTAGVSGQVHHTVVVFAFIPCVPWNGFLLGDLQGLSETLLGLQMSSTHVLKDNTASSQNFLDDGLRSRAHCHDGQHGGLDELSNSIEQSCGDDVGQCH